MQAIIKKYLLHFPLLFLLMLLVHQGLGQFNPKLQHAVFSDKIATIRPLETGNPAMAESKLQVVGLLICQRTFPAIIGGLFFVGGAEPRSNVGPPMKMIRLVEMPPINRVKELPVMKIHARFPP